MNRRRFVQGTASAAAASLLGCGSRSPQPRQVATPPPVEPPPAPDAGVIVEPDAAPPPPPPDPGPVDRGELSGDFPEWNLGDASESQNTVLMFRGNTSHTFYGTGPLSEKPNLLWKTKLGEFTGAKADGTVVRWVGTGWSGQPVMWGNRVYVGAVDTQYYCFNAETGKPIWIHKGGRMFKGSSCFYKGKLYMGNVDNQIRCIDGKDGKVLWKYDTKRDCDSSPCVWGNRLYIGGEDGKLKCMDPDTGDMHWLLDMGEGKGAPPGSGGFESSPAVVDGEVYIGHYDGYVLCVDAKTGTEKWRGPTGGDTDVSPVVAGDLVYIAAETESPILCAFDRTKKGKKVWEFNNKLGYWSTPAVVDNRLYVGGHDGIMYCHEADTGKVLWTYKVGAAIWCSPCVVDGKVVFGSYDPFLYMLDAKDGSLLWKYRIGDRTHSTPCIVGGKIYVGSASGYFYCFG